MKVTKLETNRLILRQWKIQDLPDFARLNADSEVMEFFPSTLSTEESNAMAQKCKSLMLANGWGFWAAEIKETSEFIGFVGIHKTNEALPFAPCLEIGWRLSRKFWDNGYATEAAKEVLRFSFEKLKQNKVISFTSIHNYRSIAVMERIGLSDAKLNFTHPDVEKDHALSEHVLYKITKSDWRISNL